MRHPEDLWVSYRLAANLQYSTPYPHEEAIRYYSSARALRPTTAHMLAHLLIDIPGRLAEAKALYLDLADRQPKVPSHLYCLAQGLKARFRQREAEAIADRLIPVLQTAARTSPNPEAILLLAKVQAIKGDVAGSLESIREFARMVPQLRYGMHYEAGNLLHAVAHDPEGALAEYREAIRLKPDVYMSHLELARTLIEMERYEEALDPLREVARLQPGFWAVQVHLGTALMAIGRTEEAMAAYHEAMRLEPKRPFIHFQLGHDLAKRGKIDEAIAVLREAARIYPLDTNCHNELGKIFIDVKKDFDAAAAEIREVMRINPDEPNVRSNLGVILFKSGKKEQGLAECREAARLRPEWGIARFTYGSILFESGQDDEAALVELEAAVKLKPDADTYKVLGQILLRLKKDREAIAAFRRALAFAPKSSVQAGTLTRWIADLERGIDPDTGLPR
jgi:tetratricopeptide (TPR) repeat protein